MCFAASTIAPNLLSQPSPRGTKRSRSPDGFGAYGQEAGGGTHIHTDATQRCCRFRVQRFGSHLGWNILIEQSRQPRSQQAKQVSEAGERHKIHATDGVCRAAAAGSDTANQNAVFTTKFAEPDITRAIYARLGHKTYCGQSLADGS